MNPNRAIAVKRASHELTRPVNWSQEDAALGRLYDAGYIDGSGVKNQTEAEIDLCVIVRELTEYEIFVVGLHVNEAVAAAMRAIRRDPRPAPAVNISGVSLDG